MVDFEITIIGGGVVGLSVARELAISGKKVLVIEKNNSFKIGCIEEIAFNLHLIDKDQLLKILNNMQDSNYKKYLQELL